MHLHAASWPRDSLPLVLIYIYIYIYIYTVGPRLSESQLSEPSVIQTLFQILKFFDFQPNQVINGMPV